MSRSWTIRTLPSIPLAVAGAVALAACGGAGATPAPGGPGATTGPGATDTAPATPPSGPGATMPDTAGDLPPACDLLTSEEVGAAIGKAVGPGSPMGTFVCDWSIDGFATAVSVLAQSLPDESFCAPSLLGEPVGGFGSAAAWDYSDTANIPQGSLGACVPGGLVMVTVTGDMGDPSDETGYRAKCEQLLTAALARV